jgi:hypothetical protein
LIWIIIVGIIFYFKDNLKNSLSNNDTIIIENENNSGSLENNNEEENNNEKELNEYIEQIQKENPELTKEEINELIREKILQIYLKK